MNSKSLGFIHLIKWRSVFSHKTAASPFLGAFYFYDSEFSPPTKSFGINGSANSSINDSIWILNFPQIDFGAGFPFDC